MKYDNIDAMKLNRYYILSLIFVMLTVVSFDISSPKLMDNTSETNIEVSLEEKKSEKKSDEKLIANVSGLYLKETKVSTGFDSSLPLVDQLYLNTIFKPPIFS
jgi:hypothetical protein